MPEKQMPEKTHWIDEDDATRRRFWAYAKGDLGLTENEIHAALLCEHVAEFDGDKEEAMVLLKQFSEDKLDRLPSPTIALNGIKTISVMYERKFNLGNYEQLHIGMTAWADVHDETTHDEVQAEVWAWVKEAVKNQALPVIQATKPVSKTQATKPAAPTKSTPSAPSTTGEPPVPPAPPVGAAGNAPTQTGEVLQLQTEFVRVTAPKGKPVVEFWRHNRKYSEVRFHLGGEALMKMAPTLAAAGWLAEHFDAIGEEYQMALNVYWEPSKPDGKYRDIIKIELR